MSLSEIAQLSTAGYLLASAIALAVITALYLSQKHSHTEKRRTAK